MRHHPVRDLHTVRKRPPVRPEFITDQQPSGRNSPALGDMRPGLTLPGNTGRKQGKKAYNQAYSHGISPK